MKIINLTQNEIDEYNKVLILHNIYGSNGS